MSVEERVKGIVAEQLSIGADEIKNESGFIDDLGADSLDTVELVMTSLCRVQFLSLRYAHLVGLCCVQCLAMGNCGEVLCEEEKYSINHIFNNSKY